MIMIILILILIMYINLINYIEREVEIFKMFFKSLNFCKIIDYIIMFKMIVP